MGTTWVPIPIHKVQEVPSSIWENSNKTDYTARSPSRSRSSASPARGGQFSRPQEFNGYNSSRPQEYNGYNSSRPQEYNDYNSTRPQEYNGYNPSNEGTNIPIKLSAPGLIMKAKDQAAKDELFPRKKKSEFT